MSGASMTEEQAKHLFAEQVNELSRQARIHGPDPDCEALLAIIVAENESECLKMERALTDAVEEERDSSGSTR